MKTRIRIGADPFPPYQYYDENAKVQGSDYTLVKAAFEAVDIEIEVVLLDWPLVEQQLENEQIVAAFQVQKTKERLDKYYFSELLRMAATELVSAKDGLQMADYQDIKKQNLCLGVLQGYTNGSDIDALPMENKQAYPDAKSLLKAISMQEVDLGVFDQGVKEFLAQQLQITNLHTVQNMTFMRPLHVIFKNETLCKRFNHGLAQL